MTDQSRVERGVPAGGQFAGQNRTDASLSLQSRPYADQSAAEVDTPLAANATRSSAARHELEAAQATLDRPETRGRDDGFDSWRASQLA